jgi:hypothetical protein
LSLSFVDLNSLFYETTTTRSNNSNREGKKERMEKKERETRARAGADRGGK